MSKQSQQQAADAGAERITWTRKEITEFDRLIDGVNSTDQMVRINSRMGQKAFIVKHGRAKCDAMWAHLETGGKREARQ